MEDSNFKKTKQKNTKQNKKTQNPQKENKNPKLTAPGRVLV